LLRLPNVIFNSAEHVSRGYMRTQ